MSTSTLELAPRREAAHAPPPLRVLETAMALVAPALQAVEGRLAELLASEVAIIPEVGGHLSFAGGKRFRPLLTLLAADAAGFTDARRVTAAAVGELLHTATLLHDDVIDGGEFRRGRPAARMAYGNGMAVLTGDFCLARALQAMAHDGDLRAVRAMSDMVTRMAEGEVAQLEVAGDWSMTRERYFAVIERKTAALIAWCASVGRLVETRWVDPLEAYGRALGFAFQIADDVLDMRSDAARTGKSRAQDLREGKATLPVLIACERDPSLRERLHAFVGRGAPVDEAGVLVLARQIDQSGALQAADQVARDYAQQAIAALAPLPAGPARDALASLATYVARRDA